MFKMNKKHFFSLIEEMLFSCMTPVNINPAVISITIAFLYIICASFLLNHLKI